MNMKKIVLCEIAIALAVIAAFLLIKFHEPPYYTFDIADLAIITQDSATQSDAVFGPVPDKRTAASCAESLWLERYGDSIASQKPFIVQFDEENQVWWVYGTLHTSDPSKIVFGGTANILIRKETGEVLAVWHTK